MNTDDDEVCRQYLTDLPTPPSTPEEYNNEDGDILFNFEEHGGDKGLVTLVHGIEVSAKENKVLTYFLEVGGEAGEGKVLVACVPPEANIKPGTKLPFHVALGSHSLYRLCICPRSKCLIVSHAADDVKIVTAPLPNCSSWVLALQGKESYIRLFDCEWSYHSHWNFPTTFPPLHR
eukprot:Tbor_TRINITY_DN3683_c0_g2::TRINITY_DN3683_c0_g2_i2::g.265::m.265